MPSINSFIEIPQGEKDKREFQGSFNAPHVSSLSLIAAEVYEGGILKPAYQVINRCFDKFLVSSSVSSNVELERVLYMAAFLYKFHSHISSPFLHINHKIRYGDYYTLVQHPSTHSHKD